MIPYYSVFSLILLSIFLCKDRNAQKIAFFFFAILLVIFAGLRAYGVDPDYDTYQRWFNESHSLQEYFDDVKILFEKDPAYQLIFSTFRECGFSFEMLIFFFAFLGVTLKMRAINKMSYAPLVSVLIYFSQFFLLQEMTQIRAGIATALFLTAIPFLAERRRIFYFLITLAAICFHYSAVIFLPLIFLQSKNEYEKIYLYALISVAILATVGVTLDFILLGLTNAGLDPRLAYYINESSDQLAAANIWNRVTIPNMFLSIVLLMNFEAMKKINIYSSYIIRIHALSLIIFFAFSGYAAISFRLSELIGIVGIVAWPMLLFIFKPRWLALVFLGVVSFNYLNSSLRYIGDYSILN